MERAQDDRSTLIVSSLLEAFEPLMAADPHGFRTKFRKMARDPFAFYRGTACLFYADVGVGGRYAEFDRDSVDDESSRVWIQGDLHAANFGTYMDADGRLVFDVNDFDEAYLGHWTWDLARFVASLALLCWQKALPDETIDELVAGYVRAYADQVEHYRTVEDDTEWALTLTTAQGAVLDALHAANIHCVADSESDQDLVTVSVEDAVGRCIGGDVDGLVDTLTSFAHDYAHRAREDHRLFVDAFRGGRFEHVAPA